MRRYQKNDKTIDPYGWIPGEVLIDPLTQPVTSTTEEVFVGTSSHCLWETGCPISKWVNPSDPVTLESEDSSIRLDVPGDVVSSITNFNIVPMIDTSSGPLQVPTGYSFLVRAWDTESNTVTDLVEPFTLTVRYSDDTTKFVEEESLQLFQWSELRTDWIPLTTSVNSLNNMAVTTLSNLSLYSLRGNPLYSTPTITNINPITASPFASTPITITGSGFHRDSRVWLEKTMLESTYIDSNTLVTNIPAYLPEGRYEIKVVNTDYQVAKLEEGVEVLPPLRIFLPLIIRKVVTE